MKAAAPLEASCPRGRKRGGGLWRAVHVNASSRTAQPASTEQSASATGRESPPLARLQPAGPSARPVI